MVAISSKLVFRRRLGGRHDRFPLSKVKGFENREETTETRTHREKEKEKVHDRDTEREQTVGQAGPQTPLVKKRSTLQQAQFQYRGCMVFARPRQESTSSHTPMM